MCRSRVKKKADKLRRRGSFWEKTAIVEFTIQQINLKKNKIIKKPSRHIQHIQDRFNYNGWVFNFQLSSFSFIVYRRRLIKKQKQFIYLPQYRSVIEIEL